MTFAERRLKTLDRRLQAEPPRRRAPRAAQRLMAPRSARRTVRRA